MESLQKKKDYFGSNTKSIGIALSLHNIGYEYRHLKMNHEAGVFLQHALSVLKTLYPGGKSEMNTDKTSTKLCLILA